MLKGSLIGPPLVLCKRDDRNIPTWVLGPDIPIRFLLKSVVLSAKALLHGEARPLSSGLGPVLSSYNTTMVPPS